MRAAGRVTLVAAVRLAHHYYRSILRLVRSCSHRWLVVLMVVDLQATTYEHLHVRAGSGVMESNLMPTTVVMAAAVHLPLVLVLQIQLAQVIKMVQQVVLV